VNYWILFKRLTLLLLILSFNYIFATTTFLPNKFYYWDINGTYIKDILSENSEYTREEIWKQLDISGSTYKILFQNDLDVDLDSFQYLLEALREWGLTIDFLKEEFGISEAIVRNLLTYKHTKNHFKTKDLSDEVKTILWDIENENRTQENENRTQENENRTQENENRTQENENRTQENENRTQDRIRKERRLLQLELKRLEEQEWKIDNWNEKIQKILDKLESMKI